jgi:N-acetylglucosaminyl-diphospho-decaprenol L-rhamnosyltransferase
VTPAAAALITVVVVNYRTAALTSVLVRHARSTWPGIAVTVCDNSEDDDEWLALGALIDDETVVVRADRNLGFGTAVNLLLGGVTTRFALLANPDLLGLPDLERLLATALASGAAVTAPLVRDESGRVRGTFGGRPTVAAFAQYMLPLPGGHRSLMASRTPRHPVTDVGWVTGACMLIEVDAWRSSRFDESIFLYAEDIDFCWRQGDAGRRIVLDSSTSVRHSGGASSGGSAPMLWARNLALVAQRRVRGGRAMVATGLGLRGLRQLAIGDRAGSAYLLRSARAAFGARPATDGRGE